jgi:lipopolysaccharide transport system permease protein
VPDYPLFVFAAILPWKWFNSSMQDGITAVVGMERLIKQINFPKLVLPVSAVMAGVANFAFGMIPLLGLMVLFYSDRISLWLLCIPLVAVVQLIFTLPLAIALSSTNVFYRDIGNLSRHVLRMWFYLSPGLYSIEQLTGMAERHPALGILFALNPWTWLFTAYRDVIYEAKAPDWIALGVLSVVSLGLLAGAIWVFKRLEPTYAKVL